MFTYFQRKLFGMTKVVEGKRRSSLEGGSFLDDSNIFSVVEVMAETEGAAKIDECCSSSKNPFQLVHSSFDY